MENIDIEIQKLHIVHNKNMEKLLKFFDFMGLSETDYNLYIENIINTNITGNENGNPNMNNLNILNPSYDLYGKLFMKVKAFDIVNTTVSIISAKMNSFNNKVFEIIKELHWKVTNFNKRSKELVLSSKKFICDPIYDERMLQETKEHMINNREKMIEEIMKLKLMNDGLRSINTEMIFIKNKLDIYDKFLKIWEDLGDMKLSSFIVLLKDLIRDLQVENNQIENNQEFTNKIEILDQDYKLLNEKCNYIYEEIENRCNVHLSVNTLYYVDCIINYHGVVSGKYEEYMNKNS